MNAIINPQRLAHTFMELAAVDSISKEEGAVGSVLVERLKALGANVFVDEAGKQVGGDMGNIIALFPGSSQTGPSQTEPLLLSAHMDTVEPGRGIQPQMRNGRIFSRGDTILGADDKSAIAVILEVLQCLDEQRLPHGPLEVVFTICEEIGLLGARHLDYQKLTARSGYVLDTSNQRAIVTRSPAANQLKFIVSGRAAHAGGAPEKGINAISLAAQAIAGLPTGRIDPETTCNIGMIKGGLATNIVPASAVVEGEVRSHDVAKLEQVTRSMVTAFESSIAQWRKHHPTLAPTIANDQAPCVECTSFREFERLAVDAEHPTVRLARQAAAELNISLASVSSGGGSDANVFAQHGIITPVLGTGMNDVHTVNESIDLDDMVESAQLLLKVVGSCDR